MKNKLSYFVSKVGVFGIGYFLLFKDNGKNAYISILLGTLIGICIIYFYDLIRKNLNNKYLTDSLKNTLIGNIYNVILVLFGLYLMCFTLLIITTFINSFYLIKTPRIIILLSFTLLGIYLSFKEEKVMLDLSIPFFYFSILIDIIFSTLLIPYNNFTNLLPIFNYNYLSIIKGSLIYAIITSIPLILTIDYEDNFKNTLKNYLIASLMNTFIVFGIILSLGEPLLNIYRFPEYAVLKQIKILDFIENIENISTFGWYTESFMLVSLIVTNIKKVLPRKHYKYSLSIIVFTSVILSSIFVGSNYEILLKIFYLHPIILGIFFIIFILLYFYLKFKKNNT